MSERRRDDTKGGEAWCAKRGADLSTGQRALAGGVYERTSGATEQPLNKYRWRTPERTVLHELVAQHAQTMLAELRDVDPDGGGLPRYVECELAAYLRCGVHECGCNMHGRRYFTKALDAGDTRAALPLAWYKRLFEIEHEIGALDPDVKLAV